MNKNYKDNYEEVNFHHWINENLEVAVVLLDKSKDITEGYNVHFYKDGIEYDADLFEIHERPRVANKLDIEISDNELLGTADAFAKRDEDYEEDDDKPLFIL